MAWRKIKTVFGTLWLALAGGVCKQDNYNYGTLSLTAHKKDSRKRFDCFCNWATRRSFPTSETWTNTRFQRDHLEHATWKGSHPLSEMVKMLWTLLTASPLHIGSGYWYIYEISWLARARFVMILFHYSLWFSLPRRRWIPSSNLVMQAKLWNSRPGHGKCTGL